MACLAPSLRSIDLLGLSDGLQHWNPEDFLVSPNLISVAIATSKFHFY
jgi:hypothetical protein